MKPSILKKILSYFFDLKLSTFESRVSDALELWLSNGKLVLHCKDVNYSFGNLHTIFQKAFKAANFSNHCPADLLLLGLGAGSVVKIIMKEYNLNIPITAVELDSKVIEIGKRYFNLSSYPALEIINADAYEFIINQNKLFGCVIIDIFQNTEVPEKFLSTLFLDKIINTLKPSGLIFFNFMVLRPAHALKFENLTNFFKSLPGTLKIIGPLGDNKVIIWKKDGTLEFKNSDKIKFLDY